MYKHRVFLSSRIQDSSPLPEDRAHYLTRVLRLRPGDFLRAFDGSGAEWLAQLITADKGRFAVAVQEELRKESEPELRITLVQAVARGDRMDYALQKATELGVWAIQPIVTERTEVKLKGNRLDKRMQHWQGVVVSACEQSERCRVPELKPLLRLDEWIAERNSAIAGYALMVENGSRLRDLPTPAGQLEVVIGPEGGLTETEHHLLVRSGLPTVTLGPRTLRTETTGPAVISAVQALWGDA